MAVANFSLCRARSYEEGGGRREMGLPIPSMAYIVIS